MRSWCVLLILAAAFVFAPSLARAEGALVVVGEDGQPRNFPLVRTEVRGDVAGRVVSVWVTQRFRNEFTERIEATYLFPLPDDSAVDDMEMHIGRRVVRANVARRAEARRTYEAARTQGRRAALLEQERPNIFTFSVANIDPGGEIEVRLHYFAMAKYDHGTYEVVFPMVVGPRYVPGAPLAGPQTGTGPHPDTDRVTDASRVSTTYAPPGTRVGHAVSVNFRVDAGAPVATLESPAHDTVIRRSSPSRAEVSLRDKDEIPNRDFILRWTLDAPEVRTAFFAYRPDPREDGYFALLLQPRNDPPASEVAARELFFLLDTSGSMQGPPLDAVKRAIRRALETLHTNDTFQIVDFADTASTFAPAPLAATPENVSRGIAYLQNLQASGGTNQLAGIHAALAAPGEAMRVRYVVFMTDGYIGNEAEVIGLTQREIGQARIFGFGVGSSVNRYLLNEVSLAGRGVAEFLRPQESPDVMVQRFYERIASPYLVDLAIDWGGLNVRDVYPNPLPDLSSFQPMLVFGRYRAAGAANVTVRGRVAGRPFERTIALNLPASTDEHVAIARLWAREKIAFLSREMHRNGERRELVEAVTEVALENHLVSQFTSLVAVDSVPPAPTADTAPPRQVNQPADAPQGVNLQSAGGTTVPVAAQVAQRFSFSDEVVQGELVRPDGAAMQYRSAAPMAPPSPPSPGGSGSDGDEESSSVRTSLSVERRRGGCSSCSVASAQVNTRDAAWWVLAGVALVGARRRVRTSTRARPERAATPRS